MTRSRPAIGVLMDYLNSQYQMELYAAIKQATEERDIDLVVVLGRELGTAADRPRKRIYDLLNQHSFSGIVIASSSACDPRDIREYCRRFDPTPLCSIGLDLDDIPCVLLDNASGMQTIVAHVVDVHGCRRVAYIGGPLQNQEALERELAYRRALEQRSIPFDERLVAHGDFYFSHGADAMRELIGRGVDFDAVVAANDYMALGAMGVLQELGWKIPGDAIVCGFDDINVARFTSPSLTTIRQPVRRLGLEALNAVLTQLDGRRVPAQSRLALELVLRESCGCASVAGQRTPIARSVSDSPEPSQQLVAAMQRAVPTARELRPDWPERLLAALEIEIAGEHGSFLTALDLVLDAADGRGATLDDFQQVVSLLRSFRGHSEDLEDLWHRARLLVAAASVRTQGRRRLELELATYNLSVSAENFSVALSFPSLKEELASRLPGFGIRQACVSIYDDGDPPLTMTPLFAMREGRPIDVQQSSVVAARLVVPGAFDGPERTSAIIMGLVLNDEQLGLVAFDTRAQPVVYDPLCAQIATAIKTAELHRDMVQLVVTRERFERERLVDDSRAAADIQTSLLPKRPTLPGLDLAISMIPAANVAGDYLDVIATPTGGWIAIGDVTGHGLAAGLLMLMLQSMIASLVQNDSETSPSRVLSVLNRVFYDNVRRRLERDDYTTLLLLRYDRSGRVVFSGYHDDIILCRSGARCCEIIPTTGVWVGAMQSISPLCADQEFRLEEGDLLVLYTDGVTEARDAHQELFGRERLCSEIEATRSANVRQICDGVIAAAQSWSPNLDDDIAVIVGRYARNSP